MRKATLANPSSPVSKKSQNDSQLEFDLDLERVATKGIPTSSSKKIIFLKNGVTSIRKTVGAVDS